MEARTLAGLIEGRVDWDFAAARTPAVDAWCSRSPWTLGVHHAFSPPDAIDATVVGRSEDGWVAFARRELEDGSLALLPLDGVWAFATNVVTTGGAALTGNADAHVDGQPSAGEGRFDERGLARFADDATAWIAADPDWRICAVAGLTEGSAWERHLALGLSRTGRVLAGPETIRCVASLEGGLEAWSSRRSPLLRRNVRRAERLATDRGLTIEVADHLTTAEIVHRLHVVEQASWKGLEGSGIESDEMGTLYASLVRDLTAQAACRVAFARLDGSDVGFVLGGVLGDTYRGLQLSFVESVRALSVGSLLQAHAVQRLCESGVARYDLGMDFPYKRSWAEQLVRTRTIVAVRE